MEQVMKRFHEQGLHNWQYYNYHRNLWLYALFTIKGLPIEHLSEINYDSDSFKNIQRQMSNILAEIDRVENALLTTSLMEDQFKLIYMMCEYCEKHQLPPWIWKDLLDFYPLFKESLKKILIERVDKISQRGPIFNMKLSLGKRGYGTWEEKEYQSLLKAINEEEILKADRLVGQLVDRAGLSGDVLQVFTLIYEVDSNLAAKCIVPESSPFMSISLCNHFYFQYDLSFLVDVASQGQLWSRMMIAKYIVRLLLDERQKLSTRLMLFQLFKKLLLLLMQLEHKDIRKWMLQKLIPWFNVENPVLMYSFGKCMATALNSYPHTFHFEDFFKNWVPSLSTFGFDHFSLAVLENLKNSRNEWKKGIIHVWVKQIIKALKFESNHSWSEGLTCIENSVITILVERTSRNSFTYSSALIVLKQILKRWDIAETKWFRSQVEEDNYRAALLSVILVYTIALKESKKRLESNKIWPPQLLDELVKIQTKIEEIKNDKRLWILDNENKLFVRTQVLELL